MRLVAAAFAQLIVAAVALKVGLVQHLEALARVPEEPEEHLEPWWANIDEFHFPHVAATDLNQTDLLSQIQGIGSDYVLVEFYAPWCPHCQHFALDYERVAQTLQQISSPGKVVAATVDCVMLEGVCNQMQVAEYPTMIWASKADWLANSLEKLTHVDADHTAEAVTNWVSDRMKVPLALVSKDVVAAEFHTALSQARQSSKPTAEFHELAPAGKADTWDMQVAVALWLRSSMTTMYFHPDAKKQQVLHNFVQLLSRSFPGENCRSSLASLHRRLKSEKDTPHPDKVEPDWQLCDTPWEVYGQRSWRSCRGSVPGKRGRTCGLWMLFHTLAARSEDATAGQDLEVVRRTIGGFFGCKECRVHFMSLPVEDKDRQDRASAQMWWWKTHNAVNDRVKRIEEETGDGDTAFPKTQWPPAELCATCKQHKSEILFEQDRSHGMVEDQSASEAWSLAETASFLDSFYHSL